MKVLGSASIKTVVLAELQDGRQVALMVQRPNAQGQTKSNLKSARRFLERLQYHSLQSNNPLFDPLIAAVEKQIPDELDQARERKSIKHARKIVAGINRGLRSEADGWNIQVPDVAEGVPTTEHMFAMDAVSGVSAKEFLRDESIPKAERERVGRLMTKTALAMLFRYGSFDPDRHPGNWIIDRKKKTIHFIDVGQLVHFETHRSALRADGRLAIGRFLHAISKKDGTAIVEAAFQMRKQSDATAIDAARVARKIDEAIAALKGRSESEMLKGIVTALYGSGLGLDDIYTFGGLKGLLTLAGSGYVDAKDLESLLTSEVTGLFLKKVPVLLAPKLSRRVANGIAALSWRKPPPE